MYIYKEFDEDYETKAALLWASFDKNKKAGVRFGMFPFDDIKAAESEGYDGRKLCISLMNCAKNNGGMKA